MIKFNYIASIQPSGDHLAKIFVIDTTMNKNKWMITPEAKVKALQSLISLPIVGFGHDSSRVVGRIIDFEANSAIYAIAKIEDEEAWEKIKKGEWRYTSPRIIAFDVEKTAEGEIVKNFVFDHVAFVEQPAFSQMPAIPLTADYCDFSQVLTASLNQGHSIVTELPCNELGNKGHEGEKPKAEMEGKTLETKLNLLEAGAIPPHDSPKAPKDRPWDGDAARERIRGWAGGPEKEKIDWNKYAKGFAWVDPNAKDDFSGYKLPHHDVVDGELKVVWRGVVAAMQALLGARGGVDIPEADQEAVYRHLTNHYRQFGEEPPALHGEVNKKMENKNEIVEKLEAEIKRLKEENEKLTAALKQIFEEKHKALVAEVTELREQLGLPKNEKLTELPIETLEFLKADYANMVKQASIAKPKAKFEANSKETDVIESVRENLFGYRKG
jgi:regulator of replication initiation timing